MDNFINGYIPRNSFVHKLHPTTKLVIFLLLVILVFVPIGFVFQSVIFLFVTFVFFIAKLPGRFYSSAIKSITLLFLLLLFVNWFTFRDPGFYLTSDQLNSLPAIDNSKFSFWNISLFNYQDNVFSQVFAFNRGNLTNLNQLDFFYKANNADSYTKVKGIDSLASMLANNGNGLSKDKILSAFLDHNLNLYLARSWGANFAGFVVDFNPTTQLFKLTPFLANASYVLTLRAVILAFYVTQKILIMILFATVLTSTSSSVELAYGIERLLWPLKLIKIPVNVFAMTIAIAIRFVPSLLLESQRILNAQASRGLDFRNGGFLVKMRSLSSLVVPMISIAFRNASELASAMEARGYHPAKKRSSYRQYKITWIDILALFLVFAWFVVIIFLTIRGAVFLDLGTPEWLLTGKINEQVIRDLKVSG